jgi:predicted DNA-binding transcriptional regulator YafY
MRNVFQKKDRVARLLKVELLLWQNQPGLKISEIAKKLDTSVRTIYRDLATLENEIGVPIWAEGEKRGILEGYFFPPIHFDQPEAIRIFLAIRLMQKMTNRYDPRINSTFMKLNTILPPAIGHQIQENIEFIEANTQDENISRNLDIVAQAWLSLHSVKFSFKRKSDKQSRIYTVDPYYIEPSLQIHAIFIIGSCHEDQGIHTFNINQIVGAVDIEPGTYQIPDYINVNNYLSRGWEFPGNEEAEEVKLHFSQKVANLIINTCWHRSQSFKIQSDGSVIMTVKVRNSPIFRNWILIWGNEVKIMEPQSLIDQILVYVDEIKNIYPLKTPVT